ncbi:MAG: TMEM175 family protein [Vicinamibacterales bacterium]
MTKGRLEAFSDGVIAIIITIMVLELPRPEGADLAALSHVAPGLLGYVLSFALIGIYWNNHHHMLHACRHVSGGALWANLHLLFWLSLVPYTTAYMEEQAFVAVPVAAYGAVLLASGVAWLLLQHALIRANGPESRIARAVEHDVKGRMSAVLYTFALGVAFVAPWASLVLYVAVALMWLVPDRRFERALGE